MDDYLSLRSLEGSGRSFGTERPPSSPRGVRGRQERQPETQRKESQSKKRAEHSEPRSEEASERQSHEVRSDFSRELGEIEAARTAEPLEKAPTTDQPAFEAEPAQPLNLADLDAKAPIDAATPELAPELTSEPAPEAPVEAAPPVSLPRINEDLTLAELEPRSASPELEEPALPENTAPLLPLEPPPTLPAPIAPIALGPGGVTQTPSIETASLATGEALVNPVDLATNLEAGSGSLDAQTGGLSNQAAEISATQTAQVEPSKIQFEQALAETATKSASSSARSVEVAESVLRQFKVEIHSKLDRAMIQLNPAELGRISVKIEMERGKLRAVLRADKAETLDLLERHVPELRASLEGSGIEAETFDFGLGLEQEDHNATPQPDSRGWKDQTRPVLEELEKRSLLTRNLVSEKRVDTYA